MIKNLQALLTKLQSKQIPTNPAHVTSHFARIAESFYEAQQITAAEVNINQQLLDACLVYPFPINMQRGCGTAIAAWIIASTKVEALQIVKACDTLMAFLQKKGVSSLGKSVAIEVMYSLLLLKSQLPPLSFNFLVELATYILKMIKASSEVQMRVLLARFLPLLIEEGVCSKEVIRTDMVKYVLKFCASVKKYEPQQDKSDGLRSEGAKALEEMVKKDIAVKDNFELMLSTAIKLLPQGMNALNYIYQRQVEMERQIAHQQVLKKGDKKNQPQLAALSTKEYVTKLFSNFNEALSRSPKPLLMLQVWEKCLSAHIEKYGCVIARGACEVLTNFLQSTEEQLFQFTVEGQSMAASLISQLSKAQTIEMLDYLFEKIKSLQKSKGNQVYQAKLLLHCVKKVSDILGTSLLGEKISKPNMLIDIVGQSLQFGYEEVKIVHVKTQINVSCQQEFIDLMKSFFLQNPKWQQSVLSVLLNLTTIYTADLGISCTTKTANLLRGHAICLIELLSLTDTVLHSTPIELAGQIWDTARGLVGGHAAKTGNRTPAQEQDKFDPVSANNAQLKEIGWIILARLMNVSFFANQQRLKEILIVLQDSMSYFSSMKVTTQDEYLHQLQAFGRVPYLIRRIVSGHVSKYLSENMNKFLSQQMIAWYQSILKSDVKIDRSNNMLVNAKGQAFKTFSLIPAKAYSSHINALVQIIVDDVLIAGSSWDDVTLEDINEVDSLEIQDELQLAIAATNFFGQIMLTNAFTLKNKINLLKYLSTNVQTITQSKDQNARNSRSLIYLLIIKRIHQQLLLNPDNEIIKDQSLIQNLFSVIEICSTLTGKTAKQLYGMVYAQHLSLKTEHTGVEQTFKQKIIKLLAQSSHQGSLLYVVSAMISQCDFLQLDQTVQLQLQNLFMRFSSQNQFEDQIQMAFEVSKMSQNATTLNLLKGSFIFLAFYCLSLQKKTPEVYYLAQILINYLKSKQDAVQPGIYILTLLGDVKSLIQDQKELLYQLEYYSNKSVKLEDVMQLIRENPSNSKSQLSQLLYEMLNHQQQTQTQSLQQNQQSILLFKILISLNNEFKYNEETECLKYLKKVFMKEFLNIYGNNSFHEQIQALQDYILEEYLQQDENSEKIENHIRTRVFLLKRIQKLFSKFDGTETVANSLVNFLFKACTSQFEEIRDLGFKIFYQFFEKDSELLGNYAALVDAVLSETIKREELNTPEINILNMKLISKFVKAIIVQDPSLGRKMMNFLSKGIDNNLVLVPSQFYSERGMTLQLIERVRSIGKLLSISREMFPSKTISLLYLNTAVLMQDMFVVLCTSRQHIKAYTNFRFVYNSNRSSYDMKVFYSRLPSIIKVYLRVKPLVEDVSDHHKKIIQDQNFHDQLIISFIGFLLTQPGENQQKEFYLTQKKALQLLSEYIQQSNPEGVLDLVDLLIDLSRNPQLTDEVVKVINQLSLLQDVKEAIKILLATVTSRQHHEQLIHSLLGYEDQDPNELLFFLFRHVATEEDTNKIKQLFQHIKRFESSTHPSLLIMLDNILQNKSQCTYAQFYLIAQALPLITSDGHHQQIQQFIDNNLVFLMNSAKMHFATDRAIDQSVLDLLYPAFMRYILKHNFNYQLLQEILKFILMVYVLRTDKAPTFTSTLRILLLFLDQQFPPEILQISQQAIKHMINITDIQLVREQVITYPERLKMMVVGMYQQHAQEQQIKIQQEAQRKAAEEQTAQGKIKLKMFGQP